MEHMPYITIRRARFESISGPVNLPYGTAVEAIDGFLIRDGMPLCAEKSQSAHDYFARDSDGQGLERGRLTMAIIKALSKRDKGYQARWDKLWDDALACRYRRTDHADYWVWGHDFFAAPIDDLRHIAALIGLDDNGGRKR